MNALDKIIGYLAPQRAVARVRARLQLSNSRRYEAAASGRRTDNWRAVGNSANAEIGPDLIKTRDRHRDLVRNNPWAGRAVQAIVANTVGFGITAKITVSSAGATAKINDLWKQWAETTACDADGRHDIYGIQALINRTVVESGECLIRRRWRKADDGFPVPMQVQVIEPDYLDVGRTELLPSGHRIIQGVEFDLIGRRASYWLFRDHPGDVLASNAQSYPVPASEIHHVYRQDRPGQVRGMPWGAAAMITLRDLDDYEDAYLFRQKMANCSVGAITGGDGITTTAADNIIIPTTMEPGAWQILPDGKTVTFNNPPNAGDYGPYTRDVLLRVAAAYGITFQALTGDLSSVNFSSGRMGWLEFQRNIDTWRWTMLIPQACDPIGQWFVQAANMLPGMRSVIAAFEWSPPRREMIDPSSEVPAIIKAVRGGIYSLSQVHREQGLDSAKVVAEIAASNKALDDAKIVLDSDPRHITQAGQTQLEATTNAHP
ncbi:MAG: phage portal protein [Gemmatimonadaceae bacterium]